jgi:hypothetical protein
MSTPNHADRAARRLWTSTETKPAYLTTELLFYLLTVIGVLIASAVVDKTDTDNLGGFGAQQAWWYITLLTIGYMISRGLAKSGSRERDRNDLPAAPR